MKLKFHRDIQLLVGVDVDGAKLKKKGYVKTARLVDDSQWVVSSL